MKKIIFLLLGAFLTFNSSSAFASNPYSEFLFERGIIQNKEDLDEKISKAQFWKVALDLAGFIPDESPIYITPIKGISASNWYSPYAKAAYEAGLLDKYKGKELDPQSAIEKYEALEFVIELFGLPTPHFNDAIMDYADVKNDDPVISKCMEIGICKGETNRIFGVSKRISKGEAYEMIFSTYYYVYGAEKTMESTGLPILSEIYQILNTEYYKASELKKEELLYSAAEAMVEAVGDKYTQFMKPKKSQEFNEEIEGSFEGIGTYVESHEEGIKIVTPMNGGPAKNTGIEAGDIIVEVNGESLEGKTLEEGIALIKGPKGTNVNLKIKRGTRILEFTVTRDEVKVPSVEGEIEDGILLIKINQFGKNTAEELKEILEENKGNKNLILDLRHNPGGYLEVAEKILSFFVPEGEVIVRVQYPRYKMLTKASGGDKFEFEKIVILIDEGSASASEILAGSMQDYKLATLVGTKSYGKGTVQTIMQFLDGSQFKYTIANWLTAKERLINGEGIEPDLKVENDPEKFGDEILNKAKQILK